MKKYFFNKPAALLLAAALSTSLFAGCGQETAGSANAAADASSTVTVADAAALKSAEQVLFDDWYTTIDLQEHCQGAMARTVGYAQKALASRDRDDYLKANAILSAAIPYIASYADPVQNTTSEQYRILEDKYGMEVYIIQMESGDDVDYHTKMLTGLQSDFKQRYFMSSAQSAMEEELSMRLTYYQKYIEYYATATAYILKVLSQSEEAAPFRQKVISSLPLIGSALPSEDLSLEELEAMGSDILDVNEAAVKRIDELAEVHENDRYFLQEAGKSGDYSTLIKDKIEMTGAGENLPAPEWYYNDTTTSEWLFDDGEDAGIKDIPEELETSPSTLKVTCTDTDADALRAYASQLESEGYTTDLKEEGENLTLTLSRTDWNMSATWDGTTMTMELSGRLPCLLPTWCS